MYAVIGSVANVARNAGVVALNGARAAARVTVNASRAGARVAANGVRAGVRLAGPWTRSVAVPAVKRFATQTVPQTADDLSYAFGTWVRRRRELRRQARANGQVSVLAPRHWRLRRGHVETAYERGIVRVWSSARPKKPVLEFSISHWDDFVEEVKADKHDH